MGLGGADGGGDGVQKQGMDSLGVRVLTAARSHHARSVPGTARTRTCSRAHTSELTPSSALLDGAEAWRGQLVCWALALSGQRRLLMGVDSMSRVSLKTVTFP